MRDNTPRKLYLKATDIWLATADDDQRSASYNAAEKQATTTMPANLIETSESTEIPRRPSNWILALLEYEGFWRTHLRAPRENTRNRATLPPAERRMGEWARYQRRFQARLCAYQCVRLDISPAFEWNPQDAAWRQNLAASAKRIVATGKVPHHDSSDPTEFVLARWLGRQLRQRQSGTLLPDRASQLESLLQISHRERQRRDLGGRTRSRSDS